MKTFIAIAFVMFSSVASASLDIFDKNFQFADPVERELTHEIATARFGSYHLVELNQVAATLLSNAKTCVGDSKEALAAWYYGASASCPELRPELDQFQKSVLAYLSTSAFPFPVIDRLKDYVDGTPLTDWETAIRDSNYQTRSRSDYKDSGAYATQIFGNFPIKLNPLLSQEVFRIYALLYREGFWSPQFYFTLYCSMDPLRTCPVSPQDSASGQRHLYGSTRPQAQNTYVRTFLNAAFVLGNLSARGVAEKFLSIDDVYHYHHGFIMLDLVPSRQSYASSDLTNNKGSWMAQQNWKFEWPLAEIPLRRFIIGFNYYRVEILGMDSGAINLEGPRKWPRHIVDPDRARWLKPVLDRQLKAGVSPLPFGIPKRECADVKFYRTCYLNLPEN